MNLHPFSITAMNNTAMAAEEELGADLNLFTAAGLALLLLAVFQVPAVRYISDEDQNIIMKTLGDSERI